MWIPDPRQNEMDPQRWLQQSPNSGTDLLQLLPSHHGDVDTVGDGDRGKGHEAPNERRQVLDHGIQA